MIATGSIYIHKAVSFRIVRTRPWSVDIEIRIGDDKPFIRRMSKRDVQNCDLNLEVKP